MRDPIEELAYLTALITFLSDCEGLVTFNGKAFDIPLLRTRFITNGEVFPIHSVIHLDLLPLARRLWKDRLPSRALSFLEEHILGTQRTIEDVPGWLIPSLYFDYLRTGDASPLKNVFYHNAIDIISMAALLNHIAGILEDPFHNTIQEGIDLIAMGKLYEDLGQFDAAAQCYANGLECALPDTTRSEAFYRWSIMEKRRGNLDSAIEIWLHATTRNEIFAYIELAKLYEHHRQDYQQAIYWTQAAIDLLDSSDTIMAERSRWRAELDHRLNRLLHKASK
jgi:hypothetical protein